MSDNITEMLKKVRQIEIRTNRQVSEALAGAYHSVFKGRGMDFEEAIAKLGSTSGATASQMEQLKESSINLGEAIKGASATEVAESYNYLALNIA